MISSFYMHIVHVCSFGINRGCKYAAHMYSCNLKPEQHRITQSSVSISKFLYKKSILLCQPATDGISYLGSTFLLLWYNTIMKVKFSILRYKLLRAIHNFEISNRIILKCYAKLWFFWSLLFYLVCLKIFGAFQTKQVGVYVHINVPIKGVLFKKPIIFLLV